MHLSRSNEAITTPFDKQGYSLSFLHFPGSICGPSVIIQAEGWFFFVSLEWPNYPEKLSPSSMWGVQSHIFYLHKLPMLWYIFLKKKGFEKLCRDISQNLRLTPCILHLWPSNWEFEPSFLFEFKVVGGFEDSIGAIYCSCAATASSLSKSTAMIIAQRERDQISCWGLKGLCLRGRTWKMCDENIFRKARVSSKRKDGGYETLSKGAKTLIMRYKCWEIRYPKKLPT